MSKRGRKRKMDGEDQSILDWEQENFFSDEARDEMETMWEIPQIFHFLYLAKEALNVTHLSMYEVERMLLMPRASKQLSHIMTCLLSSQISKAKSKKVPPMPYEFWTNVLTHKFRIWFKTYQAKHQDPVKVLESIGVEPEFWTVFPDASSVEDKGFEELSFKQRVWLLKTVCDTIMHSRKTVQEEIANQPWEDQFETILGTDRHGARYIYFPQFLQSDLRIYKHCIDNKVLSTVKPPKPSTEPKLQPVNIKLKRNRNHRKRKSRWQNGFTPKSRKHSHRNQERHSNNRRNSVAGSSNIDDSSLNSNTTNSFSNNNHIELDGTGMKQSRSLSDISNASEDTTHSNAKSSNYDTSDTKSLNESGHEMFKGFSDAGEEKSNITVICGLLDNLKSKIEVENDKSDDNEPSTCSKTSNTSLEEDASLRNGNSESTEKAFDNLSNSSKTDDEKLNEIIGNSESYDEKCSTSYSEKKSDLETTVVSKSDDEKLSERLIHTNTNTIDRRKSDDDSDENSDKLTEWLNSSSKKSLDEETESKSDGEEERPSTPKKISNEESSSHALDLETVSKLEGITLIKIPPKTQKTEPTITPNNIKKHEEMSDSEEDIPLSELKLFKEDDKSAVKSESFDIEDYDFPIGMGYNLRKLTRAQSRTWKHDFNKILLDLSVSNFQLVADSVEGLRELIENFSKKHNESCEEVGPIPLCEIRLVKKMTELLTDLEEKESFLKDIMKKARMKLQKEWTNFKEGIMEDQDWADESGPRSNWWILGSQGCPLSATGDATLQTLSQPTLSSVGTPKKSHPSDGEYDPESSQEPKSDEKSQQDKDENQESETRHSDKEKDDDKSENDGHESKEEDEDTDPQPRRVLRARGISSYTEQFFSDEDSDENQLEEWPDIEAVCAPPGSQTRSSSANNSSRDGYIDDRSDEEDSDQDWILPSSRKRKRTRQSASRRLKSFQHKIQNIKVCTLADMQNVDPLVPKFNVEHIEIKEEAKESLSINPSIATVHNNNSLSESKDVKDPKKIVPSAETICKIETADSVHSELDIKDEGPIFDSPNPNKYDNGYNVVPQQNNVVIKTEPNVPNYYPMQNQPVRQRPPSVVQPNVMQPGVMRAPPPQQQNYYVQGAPGYIIQPPQGNYHPPRQHMYHQQANQQMMASQPYMSHSGYMPYMMSPQMQMQPQAGYMNPGVPQQMSRPAMNHPMPGYRMPTRYTHNRFAMPPRQNVPPPNGAIIRNNMPIRTRAMTNIRQRMPHPMQRMPTVPSQNPQRINSIKKAPLPAAAATTTSSKPKTTSLIVLSDSDDEIEMIITEKNPPVTPQKPKTIVPKPVEKLRQKPTVTSEITVATAKGSISPQIIQRMSQGGISITPVKAAPAPNPQTASGTQLVVVVNETGSHYALALPNGSKLILTPEQVAQIRASNNGKLIL